MKTTKNEIRENDKKKKKKKKKSTRNKMKLNPLFTILILCFLVCYSITIII